MVWCGGDVGSRFDVRVVSNLEVGTCSVAPFVAPLVDVNFMLATRMLTMSGKVGGSSARGKFFDCLFVGLLSSDRASKSVLLMGDL